MKRTLRLMCLLLCCILLLAAFPVSAAGEMTTEEMADELYALGLFKGKGTGADGKPDYALQDPANRDEAATMLIRLMGRAKKAENQYAGGSIGCTLSGVADWAKPYVGWLYENSLINGVSATDYGGKSPISAQQFSTLLLRVLGYSDAAGDFSYAGALDYAVLQGLMTKEQRSDFELNFDRGAMVSLCHAALHHAMKGSSLTLLDTLYRDNVFASDPSDLSAGKATLSLSLKYSGGGHESPWYVQEATVSSPVYADLNGDGKGELLFAARSIFCLDPATGEQLWAINSGKDRSSEWLDTSKGGDFGRSSAPLQVSDIDGDGKNEIIAVNTNYSINQSYIAVYDGEGYFEPGWPMVTDLSIYGLYLSDLNGDGKQEMLVAAGTGSTKIPSLYLYDCSGKLMEGWPQTCGYGFYSNSLCAADLDDDGEKEIICLNDDQFILAFHMDGTPVTIASPVYGGLEWNGIPVCESYDYEMKCTEWAKIHGGVAFASGDNVLGDTREEKNCLMGTRGGIAAVDMDGDGKEELVFTAMIVDGSKLMRGDTSSFADCICYYTTFILNKDRSRFVNKAKGYDWTQIPVDPGKVVTVDYKLIPYADNAPVTADLNGDGQKEILYSANDGMLHCFSLDRTEHGAWPFALDTRSSQVLTLSGRPTVADLNGDGKQEIVLATYTQQDQTAVRGEVIVLDWMGRVLARETLPVQYGSDKDMSYANGAQARPTVADLDGDGKMEIALTTFFAGVVVYDVDF